MRADYYIEGTLTLLTEEQIGKRISRIFRMSRQQHFCVDGTRWPEWMAAFSPLDRDYLGPGETGPVLIYILSDAFPADQVWVGKDFRVGFAGVVYGHGTITGIFKLDQRSHEVLGIAPV
jgi:hypothetical protein